ncbi:MAG TPA: Hsp20/alpha crystallin family protein [Alphaproteobacteria bacterium]|nr:Hsp20/alpha crystallin family protein [Alphaproteobacteria bacterium]
MNETRNVSVQKPGKGGEQAAVPMTGPSGASPLMSLRGELDRVFDDFFRGWPSLMSFPSRLFNFDPFQRAGEPLVSAYVGLAPKVDVSETADSYRIEAELPGIDEKDIKVSVSDGILSIKGEKKAEREEKGRDYRLSERSYGTIQRSFALPDGIDEEKIAAAFSKGVLTLTLPKTPAAKTKERQIEIRSK